MKEKSDFYTLNGYRFKNTASLTEAMEDYLEMMYRTFLEQKRIRINFLASSLNVKPSSVSKMVQKLQEHDFVRNEKYGDIYLTEKGIQKGAFLLWRHNILVTFFKTLNRDQYRLEQVEKIEHFIDEITLENIEKWNLHSNYQNEQVRDK